MILMTCSLDMHLNSLENISTNHSYFQKLTREIHNREIETEFKHKVGVSQIAPFHPPHSLREERCLMLACWTPDRVVEWSTLKPWLGSFSGKIVYSHSAYTKMHKKMYLALLC